MAGTSPDGYISRWRSGGAQAARAIASYIGLLAEHGEAQRLERLIEENRSGLAANDFAWAMVGYAYVTVSQPQKAALWLRDWRKRDGVTAGALLNLVSALRDTDRKQERDRRAFMP